MDGFAPMRDTIRKIAIKTGEWAGIPMPMEGCRLIVTPKHPHAKALMEICDDANDLNTKVEPDPELDGVQIRNEFWSVRWRQNVTVYQLASGKIGFVRQGSPNQVKLALETLGASDAWGIEQEARAVNTLGEMISHRQFKQYMLTGTFLEKSKRAEVHYLFRRLRPTVAIGTARDGSMGVLAALCMHPIAYYEGSWAGAMCPTDDVIAHLAFMRGDEHGFWKKSNQHAAFMPQAGIVA